MKVDFPMKPYFSSFFLTLAACLLSCWMLGGPALLRRAFFAMAGSPGRNYNYMSGTHSVVLVTHDDHAKARTLAGNIVRERKAACVNIVPKITSVYEWEGKINEDEELLMIIKTETSKVDDLTKFVREHHPYDVPEVISMKIDQGNADYLDWISSTVAAPRAKNKEQEESPKLG